VRVHLRKERFPTKRKSKLMPWADVPFQVLEKVSDNAYTVDLPEIMGSHVLSMLPTSNPTMEMIILRI